MGTDKHQTAKDIPRISPEALAGDISRLARAKRKARKTRESFGQIDKRASGRYRARYFGADGERYNAPHTFDTITDARAWLSARRVEMQRGEWVSPIELKERQKAADALVFDVYARRYIDTRTRRGELLRPKTRTEYTRLLESSLRTFHGVPMHKITRASVRAWHDDQVATGYKTQAARAYSLMRAILASAVEDELIQVNPCHIRGAASVSTGRDLTPPTDAELAILAATLPPRLGLMVELAAWGALRWGEVSELRRGDVSFQDSPAGEQAVLSITRAVVYTKATGYHVGTPKSAAGTRSTTLPPSLTKPLRALLATLDHSDGALLFPSLTDPTKHLHNSAIKRPWKAARAAAGRPDMPFHALRHYGLSKYAAAGATTRELLDRAGHTDIRVAMRYQHSTGRDAELAALMAAAVSPESDAL